MSKKIVLGILLLFVFAAAIIITAFLAHKSKQDTLLNEMIENKTEMCEQIKRGLFISTTDGVSYDNKYNLLDIFINRAQSDAAIRRHLKYIEDNVISDIDGNFYFVRYTINHTYGNPNSPEAMTYMFTNYAPDASAMPQVDITIPNSDMFWLALFPSFYDDFNFETDYDKIRILCIHMDDGTRKDISFDFLSKFPNLDAVYFRGFKEWIDVASNEAIIENFKEEISKFAPKNCTVEYVDYIWGSFPIT